MNYTQIELYLNIAITAIIYMTIIINCLLKKTEKIKISKESIQVWFETNVILTETNKITRTSDLFNNYIKFMNITSSNKQDLVLFGKLFKSYIKEENLPLVYKKTSYAGYTNIKTIL